MLVLRYIRQGDGFRLLVRLQGLGAAVLGESEGVFEVFGRELTFGVLIGGHLLLHAGAFTQILHLDFVLQVVHLRPRSLYFLLRILLDRVHLPDIELQPVPIFLAIAPLPRKSTGPPFADALLSGQAQLPLVDVSEPADPFFVVAPQICELLLVGSLNLFYLFTHVGPICFALEVVVSLQDETAAAVGQEAPHRKLRLPPIICFPSLPAVNGGEGHFEFMRQTMIFFSEQFDSVVFGQLGLAELVDGFPGLHDLVVQLLDQVLFFLQLRDVLASFLVHLAVQLFPLLLQLVPHPPAQRQLPLEELDVFVAADVVSLPQPLDFLLLFHDGRHRAGFEDFQGLQELLLLLLELLELPETAVGVEGVEGSGVEVKVAQLVQILGRSQGFQCHLVAPFAVLVVVQTVVEVRDLDAQVGPAGAHFLRLAHLKYYWTPQQQHPNSSSLLKLRGVRGRNGCRFGALVGVGVRV